MSKIKLTQTCNITTGKLDANAADEHGVYPYFTCAPDPLRINTYAFDDDAILLAGNNASGNFHCQRYCGKFNAYQRTYVITAKEGYDIDYIFYNLLINLNNLKKFAQGSQTKFLTMQILDAFEIEDIKLDKQKKISKVLATLDKKIANNKKICSELEAVAKTVYEYWFLQYEFPNEKGLPYLSSGGKVHWNEKIKRNIPEGWKVIQLNDLIDISSDRIESGNIIGRVYVPIEVIPRKKMSFSETAEMEKASTGLCTFSAKSILLSNRRVYFHKVCISPFDGITRDTVIIINPKDSENLGFVFQQVFSDHFIKYATLNSYGSEQPVLSTASVQDYLIVYPNSGLDKKYSNHVKEIIDKVLSLQKENRELLSLRDFLLPLLVEGQVGFRNN